LQVVTTAKQKKKKTLGGVMIPPESPFQWIGRVSLAAYPMFVESLQKIEGYLAGSNESHKDLL
jgi:hypothetical protein